MSKLKSRDHYDELARAELDRLLPGDPSGVAPMQAMMNRAALLGHIRCSLMLVDVYEDMRKGGPRDVWKAIKQDYVEYLTGRERNTKPKSCFEGFMRELRQQGIIVAPERVEQLRETLKKFHAEAWRISRAAREKIEQESAKRPKKKPIMHRP